MVNIILIIIISLWILFFVLAYFRTIQTTKSPNQALFSKGTVPNPAPDGLYKGSVANYKVSWDGKSFDSKNNSGINIFKTNGKSVQKYPFKTYTDKGLQDKQLNVLKIDYNISKNPFWMRSILDEIVQVEEGEYLGKVHARIIPGLPFSLGYFRLKK